MQSPVNTVPPVTNHTGNRRPIAVILLCAVLLYLPFSGKPFHIDSPVTVYIAAQLLQNPLNPPAGDFGPLLAPWNHTELPPSSAFHATPHPPLISYYTALFIKFFGTGEHCINWAFFPFYAGTLLFFFGLCGQAGIRARLAATMLFAVSPVLFVNAQNVMYDVPLAMFCIGGFYWMFRSGSTTDALLAGLCAGCACLVKFTAGTMIISGAFYFIYKKNWRHLFIFLLVGGGLNLLWLVHNLHFFHAWQLTQNGHARYIAGDVRYRFERMVAYIGAGYVFPVFPLLIWWCSRQFRRTGFIIGSGALIWSILMTLVLKYSIPEALFYWLCAFSGGTVIVLFFITVATGRHFPTGSNTVAETPSIRDNSVSRNKLQFTTLALHTALQIIGGGFLTLYAVRYTLSFIFVLALFSVLSAEAFFSASWQRLFWRTALPISLVLSLLLSVGDYQVVHAEKQIALDVSGRYPDTPIFYKGRLGYLYYMHNAGAISLTDTSASPHPGAIAVENCFYQDDADIFTIHRDCLQLIDSCTYPLFPLRTLGGRAGFYGNDRLPYALASGKSQRKFRIYRFVK